MKKCILFFVFMLLLAGCNTNKGNNAINKEQIDNTDPRVTNVKNSTINEVDRNSGQTIAKRLVNLATSIPNVNDATAVVIGRYAIVGIDIKANMDRSEVGSVKYAVTESLKNDPDGAYAMVIADPDLMARLKEIAKDIENGEPIQGIFNELSDITGRIMPEIPKDVIEPNANENVKNSDDTLNDKEKKELKKDQEEQSNNHIRD